MLSMSILHVQITHRAMASNIVHDCTYVGLDTCTSGACPFNVFADYQVLVVEEEQQCSQQNLSWLLR